MSQFNTLVISEVRRETAKSVSINFAVPQSLAGDYIYLPGQYITLKAIIDGDEVRRDYSICSAPDSGELRVAVKEVEKGRFSKYVNQNLNSGDTLEVSKPNGRFTFEADKDQSRHIVAFVAGSGITPVLSIIKSLLFNEPNSAISILYGNKSQEDCMFYEELNRLKVQYPSRFSLNFIYSQAHVENSAFGRIDNANANYFLKNKLNRAGVDIYYLCGPEEMIYGVSDLLKSQGVDNDKIKFELFTVKLEDETVKTVMMDGQTHVTVMLDDEVSTFTMDAKSSVLDAALAEDIDAPYSCQGGICSTCLARLTEGKVKMRQNNILTDAEVAEGLILTCQSHPLTEKIYVDYDDV